MYHDKLIDGYDLVTAWQEIPNSAITGLIDTVRNRVLRFALEIRDQLGGVGDTPAQLPPARVDQAVTNYILGGTNVIAGVAHHFAQARDIQVIKNDSESLAAALTQIGLEGPQVAELQLALAGDAEDAKAPTLGQRTIGWIASAAQGAGKAGLKVGTEVTTRLILSYLGLPPA